MSPIQRSVQLKPLEEFIRSRWLQCLVGAYNHLNSEDTKTAVLNHVDSTLMHAQKLYIQDMMDLQRNYRCDIKRL